MTSFDTSVFVSLTTDLSSKFCFYHSFWTNQNLFAGFLWIICSRCQKIKKKFWKNSSSIKFQMKFCIFVERENIAKIKHLPLFSVAFQYFLSHEVFPFYHFHRPQFGFFGECWVLWWVGKYFSIFWKSEKLLKISKTMKTAQSTSL